MTAHLLGGIPQAEVEAQRPLFARFAIDPATLFQPLRPGYLTFVAEIDARPAIKRRLEADEYLTLTLDEHGAALAAWWQVARDDFAGLNDGNKLPDVRQELLTTLKTKLAPLGVLDEFQSAGVFVNWWQKIRYDLKTIVSTGWHHTLIPDDYLMRTFFQSEADAIEALAAQISEAQSELAEAVEAAAEVASFESDEESEGEDKKSASVIKSYLKTLLDDLKESTGESAQRERVQYQTLSDGIVAIERRIKESRANLKQQHDELDLKLTLKRIGEAEAKTESRDLLRQVATQLAALDAQNKEDKRKITALQKDHAALEARLVRIDGVLGAIGGQLSEAEAKTLILHKLYDLANHELSRYLNAARRELVATVEKLWDKYAVSSQVLETERAQTLAELNGFLEGLGYLR